MNALIRAPDGSECHLTNATAQEVVRVWMKLRGTVVPVKVPQVAAEIRPATGEKQPCSA